MHSNNKPAADSKLERIAQRHMRDLGFDFVTHDRRLPGSPDIVLRRERIIVHVHGCFFHQHGCPDARIRPGEESYWDAPFKRIKARDQRDQVAQLRHGYRLLTLWGCALHSSATDVLQRKISAFVAGTEARLEVSREDLLGEFLLGRSEGADK